MSFTSSFCQLGRQPHVRFGECITSLHSQRVPRTSNDSPRHGRSAGGSIGTVLPTSGLMSDAGETAGLHRDVFRPSSNGSSDVNRMLLKVRVPFSATVVIESTQSQVKPTSIFGQSLLLVWSLLLPFVLKTLAFYVALGFSALRLLSNPTSWGCFQNPIMTSPAPSKQCNGFDMLLISLVQNLGKFIFTSIFSVEVEHVAMVGVCTCARDMGFYHDTIWPMLVDMPVFAMFGDLQDSTPPSLNPHLPSFPKKLL